MSAVWLLSKVTLCLFYLGSACLNNAFGVEASSDERVLNIHVVPHTHDDVGWLKTVEQYYYGWNSTIQQAHVKSILDTVIIELTRNPNRTFTYVEVKFFSMWWREQSDLVKNTVRNLVAKGQFSFTNGGWCMHDEAATHYMGMIDQTTLGHSFLKKELDIVPTIGWQLDPFGHSATQASLMTAQVGFDALYFGRIDYQDLKLRQEAQECEGLWSSSPNLNDSVFWGLTGSYNGNYGAPPGFNFDIHSTDERLVGLDHDHLVERIKDFLAKVKIQSDRTKDNNVMLTMGSDFEYERASINFENYDLLIDSVLSFQLSGEIDVATIFGPRYEKVNIFYSSPAHYTKLKHEATMNERGDDSGIGLELGHPPKSPWSVKNDDFFPYADGPHSYWTGYFTSRTALKRLERVASSFLLAARQIESMHDDQAYTGFECETAHCSCSPLHELDDAVGVLQHHDGVSGTAKQHVANDYAKRVQAGIDTASKYVEKKLKQLLLKDVDSLSDLQFCQLLNETKCGVSETAGKGTDLYVVVYNGLAAPRSAVVGLPVSQGTAYNVEKVSLDGSKGAENNLVHDTVPVAVADGAEKHVIYFNTGPLPPVGATAFRLSPSENDGNNTETSLGLRKTNMDNIDVVKDSFDLSNGILTVQFNRSTGALKKITSNHDGFSLDLSQEWGYYSSFDSSRDQTNSSDKQNSGAYIFRPKTPDESLKAVYPCTATIRKSKDVVEVHVEFEQPWIKQVVRLLRGQRYVEVEYTVGPVPIDDRVGKEVVTRYSSPISSDRIFYTDSNGREFVRRKRSSRQTWDLNETEPVAGNYYPVNAASYIEDDARSFAVVVDRTQGGSSLTDGSIELMVQRRTVAHDNRGVGEPLNETDGDVTPYPPYGDATRYGQGMVVKGKHRILVGEGPIGARLARSQMDQAFSEPLVFVASAPSVTPIPFRKNSFSALQAALPENVMLITFSLLHDSPETTFLIRLGHQYGVLEDSELSKPVKVDMGKLLAGYEVISIMEKTLSGVRDHSEWQRQRLVWTSSMEKSDRTAHDDGFTILLSPMSIRSFVVNVRETPLKGHSLLSTK